MLGSNRVQTLRTQQKSDGFLKVWAHWLRHAKFDGSQTPEICREVILRGRAVAALPYDPVLDEILLIEQFRIGAQVAGVDPWIYEVVAGIMDKSGESPEQALRRELVEEAGLGDVELTHIVDYFPSPGGTDEQILLYLARCDLSNVVQGAVFGEQTENEDIRVHRFPRSQWRDLLPGGKINNAATLLSLMWLDEQLDAQREF